VAFAPFRLKAYRAIVTPIKTTRNLAAWQLRVSRLVEEYRTKLRQDHADAIDPK